MQTESSELTKGRPGAELNGHESAAQNGASADGASPNGHPVPTPIAELELALVEIWARVLRVDQVGLDDDFFDLGGHSLLGVELVYEIEEQLDRVCTLTMLFRNPTIRSLATELHAGGACATEPIVLELVEGRDPPVFCICGVHVYQELAEELAPGPSLYGVFLPVEQELFAGRRGNLSVEAIARRYLAAVRESQPQGPYLLLGFCFGGILAYEMAQQLRAAGEEVSLLVMLDSTLDSGMPSHKQRLAVRLRQMAIQQGDRLPLWLQRRTLGQEWVSEANRLERARTRIYLRAMRKYQVKPYPGPAVLVKPQASAEVRLDQPDAAWGWGAHIGDLEVFEVPGTHRTHLQRGNAHVVARVLRPYLDRAAEAGRRSRQHQD